MPHFVYKAVGRDGKTLDGAIEADGLELASRQLRAQGLTLLKLQEGSARDSAGGKSSDKPPTREEVLSVTSELAVLLRAGLPLLCHRLLGRGARPDRWRDLRHVRGADARLPPGVRHRLLPGLRPGP